MKVARKSHFRVFTDDGWVWDVMGDVTKSIEGYDEIEMEKLMAVEDSPKVVALMNRVGRNIRFVLEVLDFNGERGSGLAGEGLLLTVTLPPWDSNEDDPQFLSIKIKPIRIEGF